MNEPSGLSEPGVSEPATEYAVGSLVDAEPPNPGLASGDRRPSRARRLVAIGALTTLGICGVGGGGTLLARELAHSPTSAQASAAASRWQQLAAGQIFPAAVQYLDAESIAQTAHRIGIAPAASCLAGLSPAVLGAIRGLGCAVVLRATYVDQSGTLVATVGTAVFASPRATAIAMSRLAKIGSRAGIRPTGFAGTISDLFTGSQPTASGLPAAAGPYVFFYAAGYADGEPGSIGDNPDLDSLGQALLIKVEHILTGHGRAAR